LDFEIKTVDYMEELDFYPKICSQPTLYFFAKALVYSVTDNTENYWKQIFF